MCEIIKKCFITLAILFVYKIGLTIIAPGIDTSASLASFAKLDILDTLSMVSGGALSSLSIFSLGVSPYISASLVVQFLGMGIVPYFTKLQEDGGKGRSTLHRIERVISVLIAALQSFFLVNMYQNNVSILESNNLTGYLITIIGMVAGMCVLMWLADIITMYGIGNGVSIFIFAGIVNNLPLTFKSVYNTLDTSKFVIYCLMYILIIIGVVFIEGSIRKIPLKQSAKNISSTKGDMNYLPLKLNSASVIPVIFASMVISLIPSVAVICKASEKTISSLQLSNPVMLITYALLIVGITFAYSFMQINPGKMADSLSKDGVYIPGIRPGVETKRYISGILKRITIVGSLSLTILAVLPYIVANITGLSINLALGGTGVIIMVGVSIEIMENIRTLSKEREYKFRGFNG